MQRPLIAWLIPVYDRNAEERFPFKRKWYRFNYELATVEEIVDVLTMCGHKQEDLLPDASPLGLEETRVSFQLGGYHATLNQLLQTVSMAIPILKQNIDHWIQELGWTVSKPSGGRELFES